MLLPVVERREIREKRFSETVLKEIVSGRAEQIWKECQPQNTLFSL